MSALAVPLYASHLGIKVIESYSKFNKCTT
jgi:hypothetical protein